MTLQVNNNNIENAINYLYNTKYIIYIFKLFKIYILYILYNGIRMSKT